MLIIFVLGLDGKNEENDEKYDRVHIDFTFHSPSENLKNLKKRSQIGSNKKEVTHAIQELPMSILNWIDTDGHAERNKFKGYKMVTESTGRRHRKVDVYVH